jgi:hypothetical protein
VNTFKQLALASAGVLAFAGLQPAYAQSTDGYHTIQIFPLVADTQSFTQRFTFRNPDQDATITIVPTYFPARGTTQATPKSCPSFTVAPHSTRVFPSLRDICPGMPLETQYGYLYTYENSATNQPFAAYSRQSNPQGQGFSVEAFPAHTFTSALQSVAGLRRLAAANAQPPFQSNCFIGNLPEITPPEAPSLTRVDYKLTRADGTLIAANFVELAAGEIVRLLDIFGAAGAPAGDYEGVKITFTATNTTDDPGVIAFCTVQDNVSLGADFRIAKQEKGGSTEFGSWAAQDDHVNRHTTIRREMQMPGEDQARTFTIAPGMNSNTHVFYARHPDEMGCEIADPVTHEAVPQSYGLELRLIGPDGSSVLAGGNGIVAFEDVYLGDKTDRNNGANGRYTLEVESDTNSAAPRVYALHCHTGSGHSLGDIIRSGGPDRF